MVFTHQSPATNMLHWVSTNSPYIGLIIFGKHIFHKFATVTVSQPT